MWFKNVKLPQPQFTYLRYGNCDRYILIHPCGVHLLNDQWLFINVWVCFAIYILSIVSLHFRGWETMIDSDSYTERGKELPYPWRWLPPCPTQAWRYNQIRQLWFESSTNKLDSKAAMASCRSPDRTMDDRTIDRQKNQLFDQLMVKGVETLTSMTNEAITI